MDTSVGTAGGSLTDDGGSLEPPPGDRPTRTGRMCSCAAALACRPSGEMELRGNQTPISVESRFNSMAFPYPRISLPAVVTPLALRYVGVIRTA
jgi:hypothetical protein